MASAAGGSDRAWHFFGTRAETARSLILLILLLISGALYAQKYHDLVVGAVQRSEFTAVTARQDQALQDSVRAVRSDVALNHSEIDSTLRVMTALVQSANQQQLLAVCQLAAQRDPAQAASVPLCRSVLRNR